MKAFEICKTYSCDYKYFQNFLHSSTGFKINSLCSEIPDECLETVKTFLNKRNETLNNLDVPNYSSEIMNSNDSDKTCEVQDRENYTTVENEEISDPRESTHIFKFELFYYSDYENEPLSEKRMREIEMREDWDDGDATDSEGEFWKEFISGDMDRLGY